MRALGPKTGETTISHQNDVKEHKFMWFMPKNVHPKSSLRQGFVCFRYVLALVFHQECWELDFWWMEKKTIIKFRNDCYTSNTLLFLAAIFFSNTWFINWKLLNNNCANRCTILGRRFDIIGGRQYMLVSWFTLIIEGHWLPRK